MNKDQLSAIVEKIVESEFAKNGEMISKNLASNLDWSDGWERTIGQAAVNAVKASTALSVQIILDLLIQTGLFQVSESYAKPNLTVIQGGTQQQSPDPQSPQ